jgi:DNA-binding response OmpR family regulator
MERILLVEDDRCFRETVSRELTAHGYEIQTASDGLSALRLLAESDFSAVILDLGLPRLDGIEVLRHIRSESAIPVIALTARDALADRVQGFEVGLDDYLVKPCSLAELALRLRALLRRAAGAQSMAKADRAAGGGRGGKALCSGDIELDQESRRVLVGGVELELTKTEFDLLSLLMRNPRRAFNRAYLLDVVWGDESDSSERSVDNAVMRLRRKLGAAGGAIETLWGVGYRFSGDLKASSP